MSILSKISSDLQGFLTDFSQSELCHNVKEHKWIIAGSLLGTYCVYKIIKWPRNLPPGPIGLPFVGAILQLSDEFHKDLLNLTKKHKSDVVSLYIGRKLTVSLNTADAIREGFAKSEDFSDRGTFGELFGLQDQIISNTKYDERWKKLKTFIMSSLRTHGFGTLKSEENIHLQVDKFASVLENKKGTPLPNKEIEELFMKGATSVMMKMIANQSYDFDDPELLDLIDRINNYQRIFFEEIFVVIVIMDILPLWLVKLIYRNTFKRSVKSATGIRNILQRHIDEHRSTLDKNNPRDYLEDSIIEFAKDPGFTDRMITDTTVVFLPDATETIAAQMMWCMFYLCLHPEYQEKMVQEITTECGSNRPGLKDRGKLIISEAVMLEGLRMSSMAGISGGHTCNKDVQFRGYTIPKGTTLQANLYAVHYNEQLFPEPEKFKPQRFIGDGRLINTENVMPFGLGRRKCVGEALTKSQIFLYLTGLVQRFKFSFAEGHRPASLEGEGVFKKAPSCKMIFTPL